MILTSGLGGAFKQGKPRASGDDPSYPWDLAHDRG